MFPVESQAAVRTDPIVPLNTTLGPVRLGVTDRDRALAIWRDVVGLAAISETAQEIHLGVGPKVLIILELGAQRPVAPRSLGLYHVAIHLPSRKDLAYLAIRALQRRVRIAPTDHLVSEAIYLWDFDGNGIEITFETPWRGSYGGPDAGYYAATADGKPHSGREPIDMDDLLGEIGDLDEKTVIPPMMPVGTRIGHVHLHVLDLRESMRFYRDALGFGGLFLLDGFGMADVRLDYMPHVIAFNIWSGPNATQPPPGSAGLRSFTINYPDRETLDAVRGRLEETGARPAEAGDAFEVRDPAGNLIRLRAAA